MLQILTIIWHSIVVLAISLFYMEVVKSVILTFGFNINYDSQPILLKLVLKPLIYCNFCNLFWVSLIYCLIFGHSIIIIFIAYFFYKILFNLEIL
jgi:hypothetical protein